MKKLDVSQPIENQMSNNVERNFESEAEIKSHFPNQDLDEIANN